MVDLEDAVLAGRARGRADLHAVAQHADAQLLESAVPLDRHEVAVGEDGEDVRQRRRLYDRGGRRSRRRAEHRDRAREHGEPRRAAAVPRKRALVCTRPCHDVRPCTIYQLKALPIELGVNPQANNPVFRSKDIGRTPPCRLHSA
jgi:hypothetical protein